MQRVYSQAVADYRGRLLHALPRDPTLRLLDVGCDDGEWTAALATTIGIPPGCVSGIEIVDDRRDAARRRGFDARPGNIEEFWPFDDQSFDIVHANQVIEHVARLDHFVSEAWRVLRPGGRLIVCTENLASWPNVAALLLGYMPFSLTNISGKGAIGNPLALHQEWDNELGESWQHVHVVTLRGLRDVLSYRGFSVDQVFGSGYFPAFGRVSRWLATASPKRAHFIGVSASRPR
jgi:SAM-dependent methyltransferase